MSIDRIVVANCKIELVRGDITRIPVDAIVNAANTGLAGGGGVDGAIHDVGGPTLMQELSNYNGCPTGSAVVTGAGRLPAKYVFHAVGPIYRGGQVGEARLLASCYRTVLQLAKQYKCESMSIPGISTGIYGYPLQDAAQLALDTIVETLPVMHSAIKIVKLVQFSDSSYSVYQTLMQRLASQNAAAQTS